MGTDSLEGKVGRMYVPRQEVGSIALRKMKVRVGGGARLKHVSTSWCQHLCVVQ